jgi:hypothetical protein
MLFMNRLDYGLGGLRGKLGWFRLSGHPGRREFKDGGMMWGRTGETSHGKGVPFPLLDSSLF